MPLKLLQFSLFTVSSSHDYVFFSLYLRLLPPASHLLFSVTVAPSRLCYNTSELFCVAHNTQMLLLLLQNSTRQKMYVFPSLSTARISFSCHLHKEIEIVFFHLPLPFSQNVLTDHFIRKGKVAHDHSRKKFLFSNRFLLNCKVLCHCHLKRSNMNEHLIARYFTVFLISQIFKFFININPLMTEPVCFI